MSKVIIYTDGASKGNPGDAGIGIIITSEDGEVLREIGEYIGKATNNAAEYSALVRALREAAELGATSVEIRTDSELLARQLAGVYKVKSHNLQPLYEQAMMLLRAFEHASIGHVFREFNKRADELANQGIKKHNGSIKVAKSKASTKEIRKPSPEPKQADESGQGAFGF